MRRSLTKPLLVLLAVLFGAAATLYSALWMYSATRGISVELGFDNKYLPTESAELVQSVQPGSPAEHAGLRAGDRIVAINGSPLQAEDSITAVWSVHKPGDSVELTVQRPGETQPIALHANFRASRPQSAEAGIGQRVGQNINRIFPIIFLTVALAVLLLRVDDRNAWLVASMFCGFIAIPGFANTILLLPAPLRPFVSSYHALFNNLFAPLFYFFCAVFPSPSPLERRVPWLKWVAVAVGALLAVPGARWEPGTAATLTWLSHGSGHWLILLFNYGLLGLGFFSLIWNARTVRSSEAQRKIRVILWGALVGVVPATVVLAGSDFFAFHISLPVGASIVVLLWLFPLSFAYAVVKHRVLEVPVLLRRSARYLLVQRGFVILLIALSAGVTVIFAVFFSQYLRRMTEAALPGAIGIGTVFGTVLFWTGTRVHRDIGRQIDRAFFRNSYDARRILEDLVAKTRTVTDRKELAALLERHLREALQPSSLAIYFEIADGQLSAVTGDVPPAMKTLSALDPALRELTVEGKPRDVIASRGNDSDHPLALAPLHPDCLVPILGRDERLTGLVVLGMRLSEEPYSSEDKHLLAAAANQAGVALESVRMAEKIAERMEAERRAAQEMEFARQVQMRLLPQKAPAMKCLEYTGMCIPARTVGGDYYDFLELRSGRLGLVLADIAGKGVPGALLMANLQANLRSQYALAIDDLPRLLSSVNRLFYQSTDDSSYATMLFADYDDAARSLRYVNCGHLPPLLLRANGSGLQKELTVERLSTSTTVLGLFEEWDCKVAEVKLAPGDTLVLYTDGVTEATNLDEEEFGEGRLINVLSSGSDLHTSQILESVVAAVRSFSPGEQQDDITLVVARCAG
ncbi:MAG TPA: SpoIIE family protein phosphatase [Terriglobales bacterium]|nr:SpoIIE family protein phosphatase [Terriglobales bacterium]